MNLEALRTSLEQYHRRKWFPRTYPDPFQDFADYANEDTLAELLKIAASKGSHSLFAIAYYIYNIIPIIRYPVLWQEQSRAYLQPLESSGVLPAYTLYHLRSLPPDEARPVWIDFRQWAERFEEIFLNWIRVRQDHALRWKEFRHQYMRVLGLDEGAYTGFLEKQLRTSLDFFGWQQSRQTSARTIPELLRYFRFLQWDSAADWNDFPALARTMSDASFVSRRPELQQNTESAGLQFVFPIAPPARVVLQHGKAAGAVDALRFVSELAKGWFYSGMNPALPVEERVTGDPALPHFWSALLCRAFSSREGLTAYVNPTAEALTEPLRFWMQFWHRYDAALALYRSKLENSPIQAAPDIYRTAFASAIDVDLPDFLYLYDLERADGALFRVHANNMAALAEEQLRSRYGQRWFLSEPCNRKFRDLWWGGSSLLLKDVLDDLSVPVSSEFFWTVDL